MGFMVMEMTSYLRYLNMLSPGLRFAADEVFISTTPGEDEAARDSLLALGIQQIISIQLFCLSELAVSGPYYCVAN